MSGAISLPERLAFHAIDVEIIASLRAGKSFIEQELPHVLDRFYDHIEQFPATLRFFKNRDHMMHAKEMQLRHWALILDARFDDEYAASVTKVGEVHNRLGLEPVWYIGGYNMLVSEMMGAIGKKLPTSWMGRGQEHRKALLQRAIFKAAMLDMDFVIAVYAEAGLRDRRETLDKLANNLNTAVGSVTTSLASAASEMERSIESLDHNTEEVVSQSTAVAAATEEATTNVQTVAVSAEQLSGSIGEIAGQIARSTIISNQAVEQAHQTDKHIRNLTEAAEKIGAVVEMISHIASQTNLLALNATIEAARAGEAGKGFAVVANEVKALAAQTAKATSEIASQVGFVQETTRDSALAIEQIGKTIGEMSSIAVAIAAAVEEQRAVTEGISQNAAEAALGTQEVSRNITQVTTAMNENGTAVGQLLESSRELAGQSTILSAKLAEFLQEVRAA
ncbi:MAG: protoglobin domain-containing protein [Rhabdaerophilum sp.]